MELAKCTTEKTQKILKCKFVECTNTFIQTHFNQDYCLDPQCIQQRKETRQRTAIRDTDADNLILDRKFESGQLILVRCHANGINDRCHNIFQIVFERQRRVYPKFCPIHRNAYQRTRFQTVQMESKCQSLISNRSKMQINLNTKTLKSSTSGKKDENKETRLKNIENQMIT